MKKRLISIFIVILLFSQICSCFNYTEINKITFATSIIFDIDEYDNVKIFLDCYRSLDQKIGKDIFNLLVKLRKLEGESQLILPRDIYD